jgi:KUP system potassium uptake protein
LIVTVKYVALILRADNRGEGGVLALGALAARAVGERPRLQLLILVLSLGGLALFYGDGLITPAISVMSAIEGLETATPALAPYQAVDEFGSGWFAPAMTARGRAWRWDGEASDRPI